MLHGQSDSPDPVALQAAAEALHERYPQLGILSRAVVYRHPSKLDIAEIVVSAYLERLNGGRDA